MEYVHCSFAGNPLATLAVDDQELTPKRLREVGAIDFTYATASVPAKKAATLLDNIMSLLHCAPKLTSLRYCSCDTQWTVDGSAGLAASLPHMQNMKV